MCVYIHMNMFGYQHAKAHVWKLIDNLRDLVLYLYHIRPGGWIQFFRLGGKCLYCCGIYRTIVVILHYKNLTVRGKGINLQSPVTTFTCGILATMTLLCHTLNKIHHLSFCIRSSLYILFIPFHNSPHNSPWKSIFVI